MQFGSRTCSLEQAVSLARDLHKAAHELVHNCGSYSPYDWYVTLQVSRGCLVAYAVVFMAMQRNWGGIPPGLRGNRHRVTPQVVDSMSGSA